MKQAPHIILLATSAACDAGPLRQLLARYGLQVDTVSKGGSVLDAVNQGGVALVLLDAALAGSASFELCGRLRAAGPPPPPVFLLTGATDPDTVERARAAGAASCLPLPLRAEATAEAILLELGILESPAAPDLQLVKLQVSYHAMLSGSPDAVVLYDMEARRLVDLNQHAVRLFGRLDAELRKMDLPQLCPELQPDGSNSARRLADYIRLVQDGHIGVFELSLEHSSGRRLECELRMVALSEPGRQLLHLRIINVSSRKLAETLRNGQNELLEMVAAGEPMAATLDKLMLLIEGQSEGLYCSLLLLDQDGTHMHTCSGPSLPAEYMGALEGIAIGPSVGSCGTAMYRKEAVIVSDIANDPLWAPYRALALPHGLRACWSMPILLDQDTVLGSFAMYYNEVRSPTAADMHLISVATHLAGIAIVRTRRETELQRHREHLEELVEERTRELQRAKEEAEMANEELSTALENLSLTQDELVRRDKLAALGTLVAGVAHELNTPIGNSLMMASTMSERTRELRRELVVGLRRSALETYLAQACEADELLVRNLGRAADLVASFKRIAVDSASSQRRRFLLDKMVAELLLPLHAAVKHPALAVQQDIPPGIELDSYPGPLGQALSNLFENSLVHGFGGRPGGKIVVRARITASEEIELTLSDNGAGIPTEHLHRIFDPFFTTKLGSGGSGLGLYITHDIVTGVLGGRIEAASTPGQGSCFTMLLPRVAPI